MGNESSKVQINDQQNLTEAQKFVKENENQLIEALQNRDHNAAKEFFKQWKQIPLNLAFIGRTGVGKSKLINVLRGLTAEDEGGAPVGVKQTTMEPTCYLHPMFHVLKLWDLPGVGTDEFPRENYLDLVPFERYDYFVIVTATRFMENDLWLAQAIQKRNKRFIFVRTKLFTDMDNIRHDFRRSYRPIQRDMKSEILADIKENLGDLYQRKSVFLVDSMFKFKFERLNEFCALQEYLIETFAEEKRNALLTSLSGDSKSIIQSIL